MNHQNHIVVSDDLIYRVLSGKEMVTGVSTVKLRTALYISALAALALVSNFPAEQAYHCFS